MAAGDLDVCWAVRQEWVMQPPPPETVYLPFESGPYRMAMALTTVPERAWFEIDARYGDEMAERQRLLTERHDGCVRHATYVRRCSRRDIA